MELRKRKEQEFHNLIRDDDGRLDAARSNKKFYSIGRASAAFLEEWLRSRSSGRKLLDYGCGNGESAIRAAKIGFEVTGIDISDVSVGNAREAVSREKLDGKVQFLVADCEALAFEDNSFDVIYESGVLHHLDIQRAFPELARVLKPDGEVICHEGLADNPLINLYRKMTPHLRTEWEAKHILRVGDLKLAKCYFGKVEARFFHLFTIAAVPFRNTRFFPGLLRILERIDSAVLRVPFVRTQAWQIVFVLSQPIKALFK
jgi:ubiquinone/menaquinone biosynthesis C-methylase UbiE